MKELARGLKASEYWELVNVVVIGDLENAKALLEDTGASDKDLRVAQGQAKALLAAYNFLVTLAQEETEENE